MVGAGVACFGIRQPERKGLSEASRTVTEQMVISVIGFTFVAEALRSWRSRILLNWSIDL
jgi:hypothetical protein